MSMYINMEMPKTESEVLIIAIKSDGSVYPVRIDGDGQPMVFPNEEMKNCAVPVPPHGRLIDGDAVFDNLERTGWYDNADRDIAEDLVLDAPTVIPASPAEEG